MLINQNTTPYFIDYKLCLSFILIEQSNIFCGKIVTKTKVEMYFYAWDELGIGC